MFKKIFYVLFIFMLFGDWVIADNIGNFNDFAPSRANQIFTDTRNFSLPLQASSITVQKALEQIAYYAASSPSVVAAIPPATTSLRYDQIRDAGTNAGANFGTFTQTWTSTRTTTPFFKIDGTSNDFFVLGNGNVGIGVSAPSNALEVNGNIEINTDMGITSSTGNVQIVKRATSTSPLSGESIEFDGSGGIVAAFDENAAMNIVGNLYLGQPSVSGGSIYMYDGSTNNSSAVILPSAATGLDLIIRGRDNYLFQNPINNQVFKIDRTGKIFPNSYGGTMTNQSGINFGTYTNVWTSSGGATSFFNINNAAGTSVFSVDGNGKIAPKVYSGVMNGNSGINFGAYTNAWTSNAGNGTFFTLDGQNVCLANGTNCLPSSSNPTYNQVLGATANAGIGFGTYTNTWTMNAQNTYSFGASGSNLWTNTSTTGNPLFYAATGNVGIGTTSPAQPLQVAGNMQIGSGSAADSVLQFNNAGTMAFNVGFDISANALVIANGAMDGTNDKMVFDNASNSITINGNAWTSTETNNIFSTGNVGIQELNPTTALAVGDDRFTVTAGGQLKYPTFTGTVTGATTGNSGINFGSFNNAWTYTTGSSAFTYTNGRNTWTSTQGGTGVFFTVDTPTTDSVILKNGNWGIGTSAPTATLEVSGTVTFTNSGSAGWSVQAAANQACNTTCNSACMFGEDTSILGSFVDCADATADRCVCGGPN